MDVKLRNAGGGAEACATEAGNGGALPLGRGNVQPGGIGFVGPDVPSGTHAAVGSRVAARSEATMSSVTVAMMTALTISPP
jgi:hypothetical protein